MQQGHLVWLWHTSVNHSILVARTRGAILDYTPTKPPTLRYIDQQVFASERIPSRMDGSKTQRRPVRSQRTRKVSQRFKNIDSAALAEATSRRLDALENDNHAMEEEADIHHGEEDYNPLQDQVDDDDDDDATNLASADGATPFRRSKGASKKRKPPVKPRIRKERATRARPPTNHKPAKRTARSTNIAKWNMPLAQMLLEEDPSKRPTRMVSFHHITARPGARPPRKLCAVCGYAAPYTCPHCALRFCSLRCSAVHEQTQCQKMMA